MRDFLIRLKSLAGVMSMPAKVILALMEAAQADGGRSSMHLVPRCPARPRPV